MKRQIPLLPSLENVNLEVPIRMTQNTRSADLDFAADLFKAADKMRGALEPSEYKHVALGLIFLKYISEAFQAKHEELAQDEFADPEDPEEYLAENVFWVPEKARWSHIQNNAKTPEIGKIIDDAMEDIEAEPTNETLKGVLPKNYARPTLDKTMLGELVDLFSNIKMHDSADRARDLLGRVYEYFISGFASAEGKRGGEFFTPRSVVRTLVEMLEPYQGRVYDPCCGSGGMFIQSEKFIEDHGGNPLNLVGLWAGDQPHHVAAGQDEPRRPRHRRRHSNGTAQAASTRTRIRG